ncbi:hypothetical protein [Paenibacillus cymbidii]|uniref:hypothetical protein n=1 Tax=Paenibacillus cymbidii TaxID=1639034 RepID=UPI0010802DF2|nr:hypothetical protein [Paenibacillus cymbidii]
MGQISHFSWPIFALTQTIAALFPMWIIKSKRRKNVPFRPAKGRLYNENVITHNRNEGEWP